MNYLYVITNTVNGKQYVGISVNPRKRWYKHRCGLGSKLVAHAIAKYGSENFRFAVIHSCEKREDALRAERDLVVLWRTETPNGYNLTPGGDSGAPIGTKRSQAVIELVAAKNRGQKRSIEFCARMSELAKNRRPSLETRQKMSQSKQGHPSYPKQQEAARKCKSKPVMIDGKVYSSITEAEKLLGYNCGVLVKRFYRFRHGDCFPSGWGYMVDEDAVKLSRVS